MPAISSTWAASSANGALRTVRVGRAWRPAGSAAISGVTPSASRSLRGDGRASIAAVKQDQRAPFVRALYRARVSAYAPGEFVEQESFMRAAEILELAKRAGIGPAVSVRDLCCDYLGVDYSADAIDIARKRAGDLSCRFEVRRIPPIPAGNFDVVILLETLLAFPEKEALLRESS